jgi:hypothetical protein
MNTDRSGVLFRRLLGEGAADPAGPFDSAEDQVVGLRGDVGVGVGVGVGQYLAADPLSTGLG